MDSISIFNTAFVVCLSMAILFFIISVVLFFIFDIKTIYMIRSGKAKAKTVKEMQAANADTGRLRIGNKTQTEKTPGKKDNKDKNKPAKKPTPKAVPAAAAKPAPAATPAQQVQTVEPPQEENLTQKLTPEQLAGSSASFGVQPAYQEPVAETSVLSQDQVQPAPVQPAAVQNTVVYFDIVKKIIIRDTDEIIH